MIARLRAWRIEWIVWGLIALYILFFGILTIRQHDAFQTTAFDLGNVDQAVWNTRHSIIEGEGRPFHMTNIEGLTNRLGTHVEPILLPISLLYFVWSDPRALLLLQTVVIALGAWAVYLIGKREIGKSGSGESGWPGEVLVLAFAAAYLLFPALQSANVFDFHAVALAPTFFLFAFYFLETERWGWYALFAVLTMSCKEDMPLTVAMLGFYALLVRRNWRVGLATMAAAGAWFLVAVGLVMPHFDTRGVSPLANRYAYLGDGPVEMAVTLITRPGVWLSRLLTIENLVYALKLLAPVAFLSLLAPQVLMLGLPALLVNLLSTDGFMHQLEGFHYGATLAPAVVVSAAYGAAWLIRKLPRVRHRPLILAAVVLACSLFYHYNYGYTPLAQNFRGSWPTVTEHHRLGEEIAHSIPTKASLAALPHPNPHASQRQQLSMIDRVENGLPAPLRNSDYIWLDVTNGWPLHPNDLKLGVDNLLAGDYGVTQAADGWLLLRHEAPEKTVPDEFYDFARTADPQPQYPMQLQFLLDGQPILETLGFDLTSTQDATRTTFYWRALQPLPPDLRLYPFYFDDTSGQILEDTTLRPLIAAVWYPPERWQPGEIVQTSTLPWDVGNTFSIGLGVVQGDDWQAVDQRLPIHIESSDQVIRLFDGDTWARLLHVADGEPQPERRTFDPPSPEHLLNANFADHITLLGYDLPQHRVDPGDTFPLTLHLRANRTMGENLVIFNHLLNSNATQHGGADRIPQQYYTTLLWVPGEIVSDNFQVPVDAAAPPGIYWLDVGFYPDDQPTLSLPLVVDGKPIDRNSVQIGPIKVGGPPSGVTTANANPQHPVNQTFGDQITLLGFNLTDTTRNPSPPAPHPSQLTLFWQANTIPTADYTVFVHLLDADGNLVAQFDNPPAEGTYPTSLWDSDEIIADKRHLNDLPPGHYTLHVGLYQPDTGARLPIAGTDESSLNLIEFEITP